MVKIRKIIIMFILVIFTKIEAEPNDSLFSSQWNLEKISICDAWDLSVGSTYIKIITKEETCF